MLGMHVRRRRRHEIPTTRDCKSAAMRTLPPTAIASSQRRLGNKDGRQADCAGDQVADEHRLPATAQQESQPVADVILARRRQRVLAAAQTAEEDQARVKDRHASTRSGIIQVTTTLLAGKRSLIATAESRKPKKSAPVSPMKIWAGFQL